MEYVSFIKRRAKTRSAGNIINNALSKTFQLQMRKNWESFVSLKDKNPELIWPSRSISHFAEVTFQPRIIKNNHNIPFLF